MDWLVFSFGVATVSIAAYFVYLWTVDRRRAWIFLAEELVALLFFTVLAYVVLDPSVLVGGRMEDFSIGLAINRTLDLRGQFYSLHSSIVQVMEASVVVDIIVSVALAVLTAGAAIPILQAFNVGLQAVLGVMEGAATLAGTAYMLLNHLYWLLEIGLGLAFLIPVLGGMLVIPRARKVALSGLAVVFVLAVLLPYAVNTSYHSIVVPRLETTLPTGYGRVEFTVQDIVQQAIRDPVVLVLRDDNGSLYVLRVVEGSVKYLPAGNYTALFLLNYWTNFTLHACCYSPSNYTSCDCYVWPARFSVEENTTISLYVWLPVSLIPSNQSGTGGHIVAYYRETPLMPSSGNGFVEYELEPRTGYSYIFAVRGGGYELEFPNGTLHVSENSSLCWFVDVENQAVYPPGEQADIGWMRTIYYEYLGWWNRTRDAIPPTQWGLLEPPAKFPDKPPFKKYGFTVKFYTSRCVGNYTGNQTYATVRVYGSGSWNESNTRYLSYTGLWDLVLRAGEEVKGLFPLIQAALGMLYNIYAFVVLGGLAFGGLLGDAGYTLPGVVQEYFRQGFRRSFVTLPEIYRKVRFVKKRFDERKRAVNLPRKRLAFELRKIDSIVGWSRKKKAWEKTKTVARHVLPEALDIAGERLAPGLVRIVLDTYDWWVEHRTGWHRETVKGHYFLLRAYRALGWNPRELEERIYRRLGSLLKPGQPQAEEKTLEEVFERWRSADKTLAGAYSRAASRIMRSKVLGFLDRYKRLRYMDLEEALKRFGDIPSAYRRGYRTLNDRQVEKERKFLEELLGSLNAGTMKDVDARINEFFANIHPHLVPILYGMGVTHNTVAWQARLEAIEEEANRNPTAVLAKMALKDPRALHYLSVADWVMSVQTDRIGLEADKENLAKLALLGYLGVEGAVEALLGRLEELEQEFMDKVAGMSLDELIAFADQHGLEVTSTLASEMVRWGLRRGFEEPPGWIYKSYGLARIACLEAAVKGLLTPPVGLWLGLESESAYSILGRVLPPFVEEAKRRLDEVEGDLGDILVSLRLARDLGEGSYGWLREALERAEEEVRVRAERLYQAYVARLTEYLEEEKKAKWIREKVYGYVMELIPGMLDLYAILREKLAEDFKD